MSAAAPHALRLGRRVRGCVQRRQIDEQLHRQRGHAVCGGFRFEIAFRDHAGAFGCTLPHLCCRRLDRGNV
eukprot:5458031-Prymnesium_polylepis.1